MNKMDNLPLLLLLLLLLLVVIADAVIAANCAMRRKLLFNGIANRTQWSWGRW